MLKIPVRSLNATAKDLKSSGSFKIRDVQEILNGKDIVHALHRHDFFFILALQKGNGSHAIDFINYSVHDNCIFLLKPGQVHQLELKADSVGFLAEFDTAFYHPVGSVSNQRLRKATNKNYCTLEESKFKRLFSKLDYIFNEYKAREEGYVDIIKANLDIFFIEYLRQSQNLGEHNSESTYTQERFDEFLELVEKNIASLKQVSHYCDLMHLSPYQLNSVTKEVVGKAASEVINEHIVLEAKRHLLATSNQVKEIADILGYEDISYFIRFFKKQTGYSPESYRQNFK